MMKHKYKLITLSILIFLSFLVFWLLDSYDWFQKNYDNINFSTIVYQLSTPLQGTGGEIIFDYCLKVLPVTILKTAIIIWIYCVLIKMFNIMYFKLKIRILNKNYYIKIGKNFRIKSQILFWIVFLCFSYLSLYSIVKKLEIDVFISQLHEPSTIFENYYVFPQKTEIKFENEKRNLICIYLESMETTYASIDDGGGKPYNYIPELTFLADKYVSISNNNDIGGGYSCALTDWTMAALLGSTSGVPYKIPGNRNDGNLYAEMLPKLVTLGDILLDEGYQNYFMCGSDACFGGRDIYFKSHGQYNILDYNWAYDNKLVTDSVFWGYEDKTLFQLAKEELGKIAAVGKPFNFTMLTVDTHMPEGYVCELCNNKYDSQYANVIACQSRQVYEFVKWLEKQEWFANTTVILLGDHNSMVADFWDDIGDYDRRTYNCFINLPDNLDISNIKNRDFTTLDLFPTIIASIGGQIQGNRLGLGTNVFSEDATLMEIMGKETLDSELSKYSSFYNDNFF